MAEMFCLKFESVCCGLTKLWSVLSVEWFLELIKPLVDTSKHCTVGRCDRTSGSRIYSAMIYFPCVTLTKRYVISEMLGDVVYTQHAPYFIR